MAARRKCSVCKENSSLLYAGQALPELNPPVLRVKSTCAGKGCPGRAWGEQEDKKIQIHFKSYNIFFPNISSLWNGQSWIHCCFLDTQLHCRMGSGGSQDGEREKNNPKTREDSKSSPKNEAASNPPPNQSGLRLEGRRMARKRQRSKWVCGTKSSQLSPDLRSRGRSGAPVGIQLGRLPMGQFSFF